MQETTRIQMLPRYMYIWRFEYVFKGITRSWLSSFPCSRLLSWYDACASNMYSKDLLLGYPWSWLSSFPCSRVWLWCFIVLYFHTYIHTYMNTYIHTSSLCIFMQIIHGACTLYIFRLQCSKYSNIQNIQTLFKYSNIQNIQTFNNQY